MFYIAKETSWSEDAILDSSFTKLNFMLADAPRLIKKEQAKKEGTINELKAFFDIDNE